MEEDFDPEQNVEEKGELTVVDNDPERDR